MKIYKHIVISLLIIIFWVCNRPIETGEDPGIPPSVPSGLKVYYASDGEIIIDWRSNAEAEVKGYNIYRRTEFTESLMIAFVNDNFFFDDSLEYDSTYYYKITAVDLFDRESDFSAEVYAKPENKFIPQIPSEVRINARNWEGEISIYLQWQQNTESDITGYNIYRSTTPGFIINNDNLLSFTTGNDFSDTVNLEFYLDYFYKLKAVDKGGLISEESNEVNDLILEIPEVIFPPDNSIVDFFEYFIIKTIDVPTSYRIGLQTNRYFGEIWNTTVSSEVINDTLNIIFNPTFLEANKIYYWRVATYSGNSFDPNSISKLFSVTFSNQ